jgi:hypothetical protein
MEIPGIHDGQDTAAALMTDGRIAAAVVGDPVPPGGVGSHESPT